MAAASSSSSHSSPIAPLPLPPPPPPPSSRRLPPPCWTHDETLALIDSYREKWYSLRRGNLRAAHWQEVADSVSLLCHTLPAATPKTSVQCRHKVEKLRKRFRAEKQRSLSHDPAAPPTSSWVYFRKMDAMERGTAAGGSSRSISPAVAIPDDNDEEEEEEEDARHRVGSSGTRSLQRLMANGGGLRFTIPKAVRSKMVGSSPSPYPRGRGWGFGETKPAVEEMRKRLEKRRRDEGGDEMGEMVAALRMLGDSFMRMEQMKMEMAREMEKVRMEMELKRTEMMLDYQRRIAESLAKGLVGRKKKRDEISPDS